MKVCRHGFYACEVCEAEEGMTRIECPCGVARILVPADGVPPDMRPMFDAVACRGCGRRADCDDSGRIAFVGEVPIQFIVGARVGSDLEPGGRFEGRFSSEPAGDGKASYVATCVECGRRAAAPPQPFNADGRSITATAGELARLYSTVIHGPSCSKAAN